MRQVQPLVGVGMPVYNGERWIEEAVDSILRQTWPDLQLVISDNASTDGTERICRSYAERDSRVCYSRNRENVGLCENYNLVFRHSRGKYFKWASCNDVCAPQFIQRCVDVLEARPDAVLCYGRTRLMSNEGEADDLYADNLDLQHNKPSVRLRMFLDRVNLNNIMNGVIRREVLEHTSLLDNYLSSDIVLMAELALHGKFVEVPELLFLRRMARGSTTRYQDATELREWYDPRERKPLLFQQWKGYVGYFAGATRAPLSAQERIRVYAHMLRRMLWDRAILAREVYEAASSLFVGRSNAS